MNGERIVNQARGRTIFQTIHSRFTALTGSDGLIGWARSSVRTAGVALKRRARLSVSSNSCLAHNGIPIVVLARSQTIFQLGQVACMSDSGWISMADWLGSKPFRPVNGWRSFKVARAFVRNLGLANNTEWKAYCKSDKRPDDIPVHPSRVYSTDWINLPDWLGNGQKPRGNNRPFKKARAFVRKLGLADKNEWFAYCKSGKKPDDIPTNVYVAYRADWISMSDWLGTKPLRPDGGWRPFKQARAFVRKLGFRSRVRGKWKAYCKSDKKPDDIPVAPWLVYSADWISTAD